MAIKFSYPALTAAFLVFGSLLHAQEWNETEDLEGEPFTVGEVGFGLQFALATGEFKEALSDNLGFGGNLYLLFNPSKKDNFFQLGFDLSILHYQKSKRDFGNLRIKTTNTGIFTHAVGRMRIQSSTSIKP